MERICHTWMLLLSDHNGISKHLIKSTGKKMRIEVNYVLSVGEHGVLALRIWIRLG